MSDKQVYENEKGREELLSVKEEKREKERKILKPIKKKENIDCLIHLCVQSPYSTPWTQTWDDTAFCKYSYHRGSKGH